MRQELNDRWIVPRGYTLTKITDSDEIDLTVSQLVHWLFEGVENVTCAQIGANDGVAHDPFRLLRSNPTWRTWLLEPQPAVFKKLKRNVKRESGSVCFPYALSLAPGIKSLFTVNESQVQKETGSARDFSVHASFDFEKLRDEIGEILNRPTIPENWIARTEVNCVDWDQLFNELIGHIPQLILLDTEGMDAELLRAFPFSTAQPEVIVFEHLWMHRAEYQGIQDMLRGAGYHLMPLAKDSVAIHSGLLSRRPVAVQNLRPNPS